jgi:hypothetical protein
MRPRLVAAALVALVFCGVPAARAQPASAQPVTVTPEARAHFVAGVRLLQDPAGPRYEDAYEEFKAAYATSPSPSMLGNIGLCAMKLERDEEAMRAYESYLEQAHIDAAERTQIETDLGTLRAAAVHVSLTLEGSPGVPLAEPVTEVRITDVRTPVQGSPVTNRYGPFATATIRVDIHPGHHVVTVKREGYVPASWELDALPGASLSRALTMAKVAAAPAVVAPVAPVGVTPTVTAPPTARPPDVLTRPTPPVVWALGGATVVLAAVGATTGAIAVSKHSQFDELNDGTAAHIQEAQTLHDTGERLNVATDVLLGAAIVSAGITIGLYVTRKPVPVPAATLLLRPTGAAIGGAF